MRVACKSFLTRYTRAPPFPFQLFISFGGWWWCHLSKMFVNSTIDADQASPQGSASQQFLVYSLISEPCFHQDPTAIIITTAIEKILLDTRIIHCGRGYNFIAKQSKDKRISPHTLIC